MNIEKFCYLNIEKNKYEISAKLCREQGYNYKKRFKKISELKNYFGRKKEIILTLREEREERTTNKNTKKTLQEWREEKIKYILQNVFNFKYNAGIKIVDDTNVSIDTFVSFDWDYYGKSYGHPKRYTQGRVHIPVEKFVKTRKNENFIIDGIINYEIISKKNVNGYVVLHTNSLKRTRGGLKSVRYYIATQKIGEAIYSFHSTTLKKAVNGLKRKMKIINKNMIISDKEITREDYAILTGACMEGINSFCMKNGLQNKKKIKISNLLPILKGNYGYERIKSLIK